MTTKLLAAAVLAAAAASLPSLAQEERPSVVKISCTSHPGGRSECPADTSRGIVLLRSSGEAACLLGRTWGYESSYVWVADGCAGEFATGQAVEEAAGPQREKKGPEYVPNFGFKLYEGEHGQIYMRLYTYVRYLNQKGLDATYTDSFGTVRTVAQREDIQLNKFFLPFSGWFITPKLRYFLYIWSSNPAQGEGAQVVGAGNISYVFNRFVTLGGGVSALPCVRSTEGQFPYWLGVDDRMTSDEFFRGSYTTGLWVKGEIAPKIKYMVMLGNNLSQLGVSASQLDNQLNTESVSVTWLPTTGEFGYFAGFGDFDQHEKVATRFGAHYTHSREDKQTQPGTNAIENSQIRLTDGNVVFNPDLFGPGITVQRVTYEMASIDAGFKYKGFAVEGEYYTRWLSNFSGPGTDAIADIEDHGMQIQTSAMAVPKFLQFYVSGATIRGKFGNASELRAGLNWRPFETLKSFRWNAEWIHLEKCPVGYTAVPYPVGGNGDLFTLNAEMNF